MNRDLSKSELLLMLDIIHDALECKNNYHFKNLTNRLKKLLDIHHVRSVFGDSSHYDREKMSALKMITTFPEEWEIRYNEKDYFLHDNIAVTAYNLDGLIYWADHVELKHKDEKRNAKSRIIMEEASSFGLTNGWLYSMKGRRSSEKAILSIAGKRCEKDERSRIILEHLSPHLCLALKRIILDQKKDLAQLTPREFEVLSWTASGKSAWETSTILNISRRTVEFHMGNILNKLDAVNSQQAIAIALSNGLINY